MLCASINLVGLFTFRIMHTIFDQFGSISMKRIRAWIVESKSHSAALSPCIAAHNQFISFLVVLLPLLRCFCCSSAFLFHFIPLVSQLFVNYFFFVFFCFKLYAMLTFSLLILLQNLCRIGLVSFLRTLIKLIIVFGFLSVFLLH